MKRIARFYRCKVSFTPGGGGTADLKGKIFVGVDVTKSFMISAFCHELAHHLNQQDKIYPRYHRSSGQSGNEAWLDRSDYWGSIEYAYRAEAYTDRRGKKLCKQWFPKIKFYAFYTGSKYSRGFMYGYYLLDRKEIP